MRLSQKVVATGVGVVALALVAAGITGCAAPPVAELSASVTLARADYGYEMRLGEVVPSASAPGMLATSVYVPAFSSGVWVRMSELTPDGVFTRDVCQVAVTDTVTSSSDVCSVEVFERDENGNLQGAVLHVDGLDELGYFETDARKLRQMHDGAWSGETGARSVKLWGYLSVTGENKHE